MSRVLRSFGAEKNSLQDCSTRPAIAAGYAARARSLTHPVELRHAYFIAVFAARKLVIALLAKAWYASRNHSTCFTAKVCSGSMFEACFSLSSHVS